MVRGVERRIQEDRRNAEAAIQSEISGIVRGFAELDDTYMAARMQDIRDVGTRVIRSLTKAQYQEFKMAPKGSVIVASEITPADTALMEPGEIAGFATDMGGAEGHTAIMARSLELPAVLGVPDLAASINSGDALIVDGTTGRIVVNPSRETLQFYRNRRSRLLRQRRRLERLRTLPAVTLDDTRVALHANLELPREIDLAIASGAEGIGLLRTEFLFMNRETPPDEEEQYATLRKLVEGMNGQPVTIRTLDVGGEKLAYSLGEHMAESVNPALGLRAIRFSLRQPKLFESQISAILRANAHGPIRMLLPMISTVGEVQEVREICGPGEAPAAPPRHECRRSHAAHRRYDRSAGCGAGGRCTGGSIRFLCRRHQRSHHVYAGHRPVGRAGGASLRSAPSRRPPAHTILRPGGVEGPHTDQPVRRDGG